MKKIFFKNDVEFNKYIEKADDLGHRKTFHKKNEIIKIFNVRGIISSGFFNTYASRIIKNSLKLKIYDIPSIEITNELIFQYNKRLSGVSYKFIPGTTYRDLSHKITMDMITDLANFISNIHKKGIYFRAMHLGNILLHNKKLFLIDIAKIQFYPWPLFVFTRARAFRRMIKYQDDIKNFGLINYKNLISEYINSSKFNYFERIRFQLYLTLFSKIKYKYFKKILGATILLVVLLWLI
ncbi:MAG: hypothetical protein JXQ86_06435 [Methylophilaceae bacterium]